MRTKSQLHRVFLKSFGCSSNAADGEFMAGCLSNAGFEIVGSAREADVLIYNTCAVKTPTENRVIEVLKRAAVLKDKRLIVTGCLPLVSFDRLKAEVRFDGVLGPSCSASIVEAVDQVVSGKPVVQLNARSQTKFDLDLPKLAVNPVISIIPVAHGCLGSCSYCCVVLARGHLRSCSIDEVTRRVKCDLDSGAKEVWLTGQDMASYGKDIGSSLVNLLDKVCKVEGKFFVRVGMMTPNLALSMLSKLIETFKNEHVFKFLHVPVQSGDDEVLNSMNRFYSVEDFRRIVTAFRRAIPDITLATDVICGFPGESDPAFEGTLKLIEEAEPDVVNISKFFPRPKTAAEKMIPRVPAFKVTERSKKLARLTKKLSSDKNRAWMNWEGRILVDENGKLPGSFIGRNFSYKPIVIKNRGQSLLGSFVQVHVTNTFQTYLEADIK